MEIGEGDALEDAIADAFDGADLQLGERFEIKMRQHGLLRALNVSELSGGALRCQTIIVSHSEQLVAELACSRVQAVIELQKFLGRHFW